MKSMEVVVQQTDLTIRSCSHKLQRQSTGWSSRRTGSCCSSRHKGLRPLPLPLLNPAVIPSAEPAKEATSATPASASLRHTGSAAASSTGHHIRFQVAMQSHRSHCNPASAACRESQVPGPQLTKRCCCCWLSPEVLSRLTPAAPAGSQHCSSCMCQQLSSHTAAGSHARTALHLK